MVSQATLNYQTENRFIDGKIKQYRTAPATAELWAEYQNRINNTENKILSHEYGMSEASLDYYANRQNSQANDPLEILIDKENRQARQEEAETFLGSLSTCRRNIVIDLKDGKSPAEIADKIGCTEPNISYHIKKIWEELPK